jgi:hypothetical protein
VLVQAVGAWFRASDQFIVATMHAMRDGLRCLSCKCVPATSVQQRYSATCGCSGLWLLKWFDADSLFVASWFCRRRVSQVSCGPYHAAAIGSDGRLFTWGDGLFGKLGHGDHCTSPTPRFVTTLAGNQVE